MIFHGPSCIDTVEGILSDCRDTGAGTTENLKKWLLLLGYTMYSCIRSI